MDKEMEKEELQSRREFFKESAKKVLPMLAAIALASNPIIAQKTMAMGCNSGCVSTCAGTCKGTCRTGCQSTCYTGCYTHCESSCKGSCRKLTKY